MQPRKPDFKCTHYLEFSAHYVSKDWEDTTVATKCSKCGKAHKTVPVEGKAMAAASTSASGKTPLTVESVQEVVVKALVTQAPAAASFVGMHEFEGGNGFGLGEHTAVGAISEGATADDEGADDEGTAGKADKRPRRGHNQADKFMCNLSMIAVGLAILSVVVGILSYVGAHAGEVGSDMFSTTRAWAKATINALSAAFINYGWVSIALLSIFMALQPAAAYSVAGIGHRAHSPAISSAMHLGTRAKLDPAVWAPVESSFGGEHNSSQSAKWAWGEVEDMPQTSCNRYKWKWSTRCRQILAWRAADTSWTHAAPRPLSGTGICSKMCVLSQLQLVLLGSVGSRQLTSRQICTYC